MKIRGFPISYIFESIHYIENSIQLKKGDRMLFYTDGITEIENLKNEQFGLEGVLAIVNRDIKNNNGSNTLKSINSEIKKFRWGDHEDDYAVVLMEVLE